MVHHDACPLCSSSEISSHFRCTDHFISKEEFSLFRCGSCGFIFTQDYPDEKEIGEYYKSDNYISHSDTSKGFFNKVYLLARTIMLRRKKGLVTRVTGVNKGSLMDIGSGTGYFAGEMKSAGWEVKGIEINKEARELSVSRFGLDAFDPLLISSFEANSFDCITLWHVLEHFHDPFKYASEISRLLKRDGICLIALPNSNSYDAEYYGSSWAALDVPRHLWHFNPDTFRLFSVKAGFIIENIRTLPLDVFYISALSEKYIRSGLSFIKGMAKAVRFSFLAAFNKERSSSVIYILRKSE
jgi:SAM-dependent methyltransferase